MRDLIPQEVHHHHGPIPPMPMVLRDFRWTEEDWFNFCQRTIADAQPRHQAWLAILENQFLSLRYKPYQPGDPPLKVVYNWNEFDFYNV